MATKFGLAQPVRRVEDLRLLKGGGRYTDDIHLPGETVGVVVRSPHACARILSIDTASAAAMPGVLAVITGADLKQDNIGDRPCLIPLQNRDGSQRKDTPFPVLASEMVRFVGDAVAFVVAETHQQARDAAEAVAVEYDILPSVTDLAATMDDGAPQVWPDAPHNVCFDWAAGDEGKTEELFRQAAHVTRLTVVNNRVVVNSMEARAAVAEYDPLERAVHALYQHARASGPSSRSWRRRCSRCRRTASAS